MTIDDPGGTRTHDLEIKSLLLYRLSYRVARPDGGASQVTTGPAYVTERAVPGPRFAL